MDDETKAKLVIRDGKVMAILRPQDAAKALAMVNEITQAEAAGDITPEEAQQRFNDVISAQPYTFEGLPTKDGDLVDPETGEKVGRVKPGDSFLDFEDVKKIVALNLN